jgi:hypothetical protein
LGATDPTDTFLGKKQISSSRTVNAKMQVRREQPRQLLQGPERVYWLHQSLQKMSQQKEANQHATLPAFGSKGL